MDAQFPASTAEHRVLLVDDDALVLESLSILLGDRWKVSTALSAAKAREALAQHETSVIVADDRMPGESGVELLAWAADRYPGTIRILLTGYADASSVVRAVNEGRIWHYVRKPWDNHALMNLIERGIELRESQRALEQSERLYRELFENAHLGILRIAMDGRIVEANRAFAESLGRSDAEELVDVVFGALCAEDGCWDEAFGVLLDRRVVDNVELKLRRADSTKVHLLVNASLRQSWDGEEVIEASTLDLTEQRQAVTESAELREQLGVLQRNDAINTLSGGIAHDFSNQMTVILNTASYALEIAPDGDEEIGECMGDINEAATAAADLSRQLVTFARGGRGERHPIDVNAVVSRVARLLGRAGGGGHEVETALADELPSVMGNAGQLLHCFLNLGLNACEAMPEGGRLLFESRLDSAAQGGAGGRVLVSVKDSGTGISPKVREKIFEPFYTTKGGSVLGGGTGLGLAMVKGVVEQHSGAISVESVLGKGSVFTVSLPSADDEAEGRAASSPPIAHREGLTLLLADDVPAIRKLLGKALSRSGFEVLKAANGQEAVDLVEAHPEVDLVILDVVMPVLSGEDAFPKIRALRPDLPVIFTTGHVAALRLGAILSEPKTALVKKPFGAPELTKAMGALLES